MCKKKKEGASFRKYQYFKYILINFVCELSQATRTASNNSALIIHYNYWFKIQLCIFIIRNFNRVFNFLPFLVTAAGLQANSQGDSATPPVV